MKRHLHLLVTLSPSMPHFRSFAQDDRLSGIRINSAMMQAHEIEGELSAALSVDHNCVPLFFDLKGRQLRIRKVIPYPDHVELELNHRIVVECPTPVLFKAGEDHALLQEVQEQGPSQPQRLIFDGGPRYNLAPGESLCIRHASFNVLDNTFPDYEVERIEKVVASGWPGGYVLSYVESQRDIDEFRSYVGPDVEIHAKIESRKGLDWVANGYRPQQNLRLLAARGDLYVEVERPHEMLEAQRLIIEKDPSAIVGSRILLSCGNRPVPDAADFSELAWLYDIGYRTMMLCDEICLQENLLARAVNVFDAFREDYANRRKATTGGAPAILSREAATPGAPTSSKWSFLGAGLLQKLLG